MAILPNCDLAHGYMRVAAWANPRTSESDWRVRMRATKGEEMGRPPHKPIFTPGDGKRIVRDSTDKKRPRDEIDDGRDQFLELDAVTAKLVRSRRVNLQIPIVDPVVMDRVLLFIEEELPGLRARLKHIPDRRARTLLAQMTLSAWNRQFAKMCGVSSAPKTRTRRKKVRQEPSPPVVVSADASFAAD